MQKTKIEWADWVWNPITGCRHGCAYCYARAMAARFHGGDFAPKLHDDKLKSITTAGGIVFAGSNGDMFGNWVPASWLRDVVIAMNGSLITSTFMLLTKNPARYHHLLDRYPSLRDRSNIWLGTTIDAGYASPAAPPPEDRIREILTLDYPRRWVSIEPFDPSQVSFYKQHTTLFGCGAITWFVIGFKTGAGCKYSLTDIVLALDFVDWIKRLHPANRVFVKNSVIAASGVTDCWPREFPPGVQLATKEARYP